MQELFRKNINKIAEITYTRIKKLAPLMNDTTSIEDLIDRSTLHPLTKKVISYKASKKLTLSPIGEAADPIKICPECLIEDEAEFGVGYLHRQHQIPGVAACEKHKILLISSCSNCNTKLLDFTFPFAEPSSTAAFFGWGKCGCGWKLANGPRTPASWIQVNFSKMAFNLLTGNVRSCSSVFISACKTRYQQTVQNRTHFGWRAFYRLAIEKIPRCFLLSIRCDFYEWGGCPPHPATFMALPIEIRILYIYALFGDFETFEIFINEAQLALAATHVQNPTNC